MTLELFYALLGYKQLNHRVMMHPNCLDGTLLSQTTRGGNIPHRRLDMLVHSHTD